MTTRAEKMGLTLAGEDASLRTRAFKKRLVETLPDGRKRYEIGGAIGPLHYRDDPFDTEAAYEEIDTDVTLTPAAAWDAEMTLNGYKLQWWQSLTRGEKTYRYVMRYQRAGRWLAMAPVALAWVNDAGQRQLISSPQAVGAPAINNDQGYIYWADAFGPGLGFGYTIRPDECFKYLRIRAKSDLPTPTISLPGLRLTLVMAAEWELDAAQVTASNGVVKEAAVAKQRKRPMTDNPTPRWRITISDTTGRTL